MIARYEMCRPLLTRGSRDSGEGLGLRTEAPTAAARLNMILNCTSREYHGGGIAPACDLSDIITKMAHSGLVLILESDTENLERTQERTRKLSQG